MEPRREWLAVWQAWRRGTLMNVNENTVCGEWQDGPHGRWRFCAPRAMLGLPEPPKQARTPHPETTPFPLTTEQEDKARRLLASALEGDE